MGLFWLKFHKKAIISNLFDQVAYITEPWDTHSTELLLLLVEQCSYLVEPSRTAIEILASSWNFVWCDMLRHRQICQCSSSGPWWPRATLSALPTNARSLTFFSHMGMQIFYFCVALLLLGLSFISKTLTFVSSYPAGGFRLTLTCCILMSVSVDPLSESNVLSPLPFQKPGAHVM